MPYHKAVEFINRANSFLRSAGFFYEPIQKTVGVSISFLTPEQSNETVDSDAQLRFLKALFIEVHKCSNCYQLAFVALQRKNSSVEQAVRFVETL